MEPRSWFRCRGNNRRSDRVSNRPAGDISKSCSLVRGPNQTVIQPPSWVFAPFWTTLYVLMAIVVWRILRSPDVCAARRLALTLFFIQLMLNAAWPWMFFGANNPLLGVINIIPQFLVILGHGRRILSAR